MIGLVQGDALKLPLNDASVQCVVTSPPYWSLRDYKVAPSVWGGRADCGHEWSDEVRVEGFTGKSRWQHAETKRTSNPEAWGTVSQGQFCTRCDAWLGCLGLEPSPQLYIQHLVWIFREVRRVLRKDGTLFLNIGDCWYSGTRGNYMRPRVVRENSVSGKHADVVRAPNRMPQEGLKDKDLVGIPWMLAFALRDDGWWLRTENIWNKPNTMPSSVKDRTTRAHEHVFMLTKSGRYFYNYTEAAEPIIYGDHPRNGVPDRPPVQAPGQPIQSGITKVRRSGNKQRLMGDDRGRPGHHVAGSVPWEDATGLKNRRSVWTIPTQPTPEAHFAVMPEELAEVCIKSGTKVGDMVLDPFCGSGTVGRACAKLSRSHIGIDLNPEFLAISEKRQTNVQIDMLSLVENRLE